MRKTKIYTRITTLHIGFPLFAGMTWANDYGGQSGAFIVFSASAKFPPQLALYPPQLVPAGTSRCGAAAVSAGTGFARRYPSMQVDRKGKRMFSSENEGYPWRQWC